MAGTVTCFVTASPVDGLSVTVAVYSRGSALSITIGIRVGLPTTPNVGASARASSMSGKRDSLPTASGNTGTPFVRNRAAARAGGGHVFFEASVAGGIPIIKAMREGLVANRFKRIFGILNTLLSVASFLPVIAAPAIADVLNLIFPGAGIPVVMAGLGLVTLWAGIASWRHNARSGLHAQTASGSYAQGDAPPPADEPGSPGTDAH